MRIATWNVNSIRARMPNVLSWLQRNKPDVLLMQEIKCETEAFPAMEFKAAGYDVHAFGQKSYNGVALASLHKIEEIKESLPGEKENAQARYLEATIQNVRVASLYAPNGNPMGSEKYAYKLDWMGRLKKHADALLKKERRVVLGGDFNVIPEACDVYDPKGWEQDALFCPSTRASFREILNLGYVEALRALYPNRRVYSFWDYQGGAWQQDKGLRIDHFLLSPEAADRMKDCFVDRDERGKDKASDHAPVFLDL